MAGTWREMRRMAQNGTAEAGRTMQAVLKLIHLSKKHLQSDFCGPSFQLGAANTGV